MMFRLLCTLVAIACLPWTAQAQFQLDIAKLALASNQVDEVQPAKAANQHGMGIGFQQNIDAWIFNRHRNATGARSYLENQLKAKVAAIKASAEVPDEQVRRLQLAGNGDITRFFQEVDVLRDEFKGQPQNGFNNQMFQKVQPLQQQLQKGLFATDSMFAMVTQHTLDDDQRERFVESERGRLKAAYFDNIKLTISELEKSTPMTAEQRDKLVALLEESDPPENMGAYMYYYVLFQLSKKQNQVNKIFTKRGQRETMQQALNQGRAMQQFLKQNGLIK